MRFLRILPVAFVLAAAPAVHAARATAPTLRVMSFNVRYPSPDDGPNLWEKRRDLMVETIRAEHPDVIGTQELYKEQGDYLVGKLPHYAWFGEGRRGGDGDEHMGVFYRTDRLRVVQSGNFWLSDTPDVPGSDTWGTPFPRMVTWAEFERIGDGRRFTMYDTHLPYREEDELARTRGAELILKRLRALPADEPVVLTGDFNTSPDKPAHAVLTQLLHDARIEAPIRRGPDKTFHDFTGKPDQRIDWILYRGFEARSMRTVTTHRGKRYPSDHFPVVANLAWPRHP
jgi:endonuclease/exonuclease/phosphatase family metal-dependent hydrolase